MHKRKATRMRRARRARMHMSELGVDRLTVHRTSQHIYAQIIATDGATTLASAATVESAVSGECDNTGNCGAARVVGRTIAERARAAGIDQVAFDRSGFAFHGRIKALADAARESGLKF